MKKYETIIFDLDDTLIDNNKSINHAFREILKLLNIPYTNKLFNKWKEFDTSYWHTWESGKMYIPDYIKTLEEKITYLRANRFILFFKDISLNFEKAVTVNDVYCSALGINIVEIKHAKTLLSYLNKNHEIIIATNGPKDAAINKLFKTSLNKYISFIVCSEEIGYSKPMKEYFDELFLRTKNKNKSKMLLIGDSLTTDILGGMKNGIDTCFFNKNNVKYSKEFKPTIEIHELNELIEIL